MQGRLVMAASIEFHDYSSSGSLFLLIFKWRVTSDMFLFSDFSLWVLTHTKSCEIAKNRKL